MKISILGTNGFLSNAIGKYANSQNWILDMYGIHKPTEHLYNKFYEIDLMKDELDLTHILDSDIIIYAIGAGIQSNLKESHNQIFKLNVDAPVRICNKLKDNDFHGTFVTFGSVFEMGETTETHFFTEKEVLLSTANAPNDYAVSKRMLSRFIASYKHNYTHWHFYIPTIYGAGENPKRLIPYVINAILKKEKLYFTAGDQIRQYVHVSEIPRILDIAYKKNLPSGIYNIEGKETLTVKELVTLIHHFMNEKVSEECFGKAKRADINMKYLALDGTKLKQAIGFEPIIKISDTLTSYLTI